MQDTSKTTISHKRKPTDEDFWQELKDVPHSVSQEMEQIHSMLDLSTEKYLTEKQKQSQAELRTTNPHKLPE